MAIDINIPSQVKTFANLAAFPVTGSLKTIFIAEDTNKTYRWTGSVYVEVSAAGATGITIGTTAITSGTVGRVLFEGTGNVVQESANLFWDNTNGRLGIGVTPTTTLDVNGTIKASTLRADALNNTANTITLLQFSGTGNRLFDNSGTQVLNLRGGNLQIGTTTDAGFKLDVNGTARVSGNTTVTGTIAIGSSSTLNLTGAINSNLIQGTQTIEYRSGGSSINRAFHYFTNSLTFNPTVDFIPHVTMAATFGPTSGTGTYAQLVLQPTINQTGGANGITRGLYIAPTLTSASDFRAIETTNGKVIFGNLPTSPAGLPTGAIWNDAGTLKIV